jgi:predicted Zn-dependent protease
MRRFRAGAGSPEPSNMALLELDPDYYPALQRAAKYRSINHGKPAEAVALIERAIRVDPENPWAPHTAVAFYLDADDRAGGEAVAALTPVSRQTAAVLLAQHGGDRRRAGELALGPRAFEFGFNESWGVAEALRDYALLTRDTGRSEELLRTRYGLPANEPWTLDVANFRSAVPLAHVWLVRGDSGRARELLRAVVDWTAGDTRFGRVYKRRTRAQALMLLGDTDLALRELEASFLEDRDFTQWWYTLDHDPVWDGVRADARFLAMAQAVRLFGRRERELLETMRQRGDVPVRGPSSATGG